MARDLLDVAVGEVVDDAVDAELVVTQIEHTPGPRSTKHLADVAGPEALPRAGDGRQDLLGDLSGVEHRGVARVSGSAVGP